MVKSQALEPTKITFVIGSLARGGAEGQLLELLRRLDRSRWQPSLVLFEDSMKSRATDLVNDIYCLGIGGSGHSNWRVKGWKVASAVIDLSRRLHRTKPQLLHAILPASFVLAVPAARIAGIPVLLGSRRSLTGCYRRTPFLAKVDRTVTRMCDFAVGNCHAVTDELINGDGMPQERTATIYNGIDTNRFRPGDRSFRHSHGWTEEHVVIGIVANFIPYKRHDDFVRAAGLVIRQSPQARFVMAGEDRGILSELRRQISAAGLEPYFTIIPGTSEPERLYPAMDAYLCTSETEGFSNVLLEAAASGLPIVATEVGGNPEIVFPGENGYLVPVGEPGKAARALIGLIQDEGSRKTMGLRARQIVIEKHSLDVMVREHEELYERLLFAGSKHFKRHALQSA